MKDFLLSSTLSELPLSDNITYVINKLYILKRQSPQCNTKFNLSSVLGAVKLY